MDDYGITKYCYGEFRCPKCNKLWSSNQAWLDGGQQCKRCKVSVKPHNLEPLYSYVCPNYDCAFTWTKNKVDPSFCQKCGTPGLIFENHDERQKFIRNNGFGVSAPDWSNESDKKTTHIRELCEKCQQSPFNDCRVRFNKTNRTPAGNKSFRRQNEGRRRSMQYQDTEYSGNVNDPNCCTVLFDCCCTIM